MQDLRTVRSGRRGSEMGAEEAAGRARSATTVDMTVVRGLTMVGARIAGQGSLSETLQAVADGIVDVLGFGVAAVNHQRADGDFEVVAFAGDEKAGATILGSTVQCTTMLHLLEESDDWGGLRFLPHDRVVEDDLEVFWAPEAAVLDVPDAWHPDDMLLAPLYGLDHELVGVVSVDLPPDGVRPSVVLRELLELFTMQAGIAIDSVEMHDRYRRVLAAREALLEDLATRDALTGLGNRRALHQALTHSVRRASPEHTGALLFCDVDGLKQLNDNSGHAAGDAGLQAWARELVDCVREGDLVCRLGGDEFVVVANRITPEDAEVLADRIRADRHESDDLAGLTLSVGVAAIDGRQRPEELLEHADRAMYLDKVRRKAAR